MAKPPVSQSPQAARDARLSAAIDRGFGERFQFTGRMPPASGDVNAREVDDPSRPMFECTGIWEATTYAEFPVARGSLPDDVVLRRNASWPSVSVAVENLTWLPIKGTRCVRMFSGDIFEVAKASPDDMGRILFFLSKKART